MFPNLQHRAQRGFAIVSAIFLLVALAALGGFIATVSTTQHIGSAQDFQGTQVYYAARSGAEWGLYQALKPTPSCVAASRFMVSYWWVMLLTTVIAFFGFFFFYKRSPAFQHFLDKLVLKHPE